MLNKTLFISTVVCLTMLSSSIVSVSLIPQLITSDSDEETTKVVGDTSLMPAGRNDGQVSSRHGGRTDIDFWDLFPTHFGDFFEIFVFFMELKWHYEIEDAIAEASGRIDEHLVTSDGVQHKDDDFLLDFAKHHFVNNETPLWKFKA